MALYIDDILVFGPSSSAIKPVKKKLVSFHPMKDSGLCKKILDIRITWKKDRITLDQQYYSEQILIEFGMEKSHPETIPLGKSVNLQGESPRLRPSEHSTY